MLVFVPFNTSHGVNKADELAFDIFIPRIIDYELHEAQRVHAHFHQRILLVLVILFNCFSYKKNQNLVIELKVKAKSLTFLSVRLFLVDDLHARFVELRHEPRLFCKAM